MTVWGCFTNVSWALQNILSKFVYRRNRTTYENFKPKFCTCTQSHALGTRTKFQLEILIINVISAIVYFSWDYFGELPKHQWNNPLNMFYLSHHIFSVMDLGQHCSGSSRSLWLIAWRLQAITWTNGEVSSWNPQEHIPAGLKIPNSPIANAMKNREGLQLIPYIIYRLAFIFFATFVHFFYQKDYKIWGRIIILKNILALLTIRKILMD